MSTTTKLLLLIRVLSGGEGSTQTAPFDQAINDLIISTLKLKS